jgi:hypothetical protein
MKLIPAFGPNSDAFGGPFPEENEEDDPDNWQDEADEVEPEDNPDEI